MNLLFIIGRAKNMHNLSRDVNMTLSHLSNVTDQWEKEGLIKKKRIGREVEIEVTKLGNKISEGLQKLDDLVTGKTKINEENSQIKLQEVKKI